ncbi:MAG TPA: potassium channel family protein [Dehalococcoidia bacterium]
MTLPDYNELAAAKRRTVVLKALLRAMLTAVGLLALYYLMPMDRGVTAGSILLLIVGGVVFVVMFALQTRSILNADFPVARAVEALAASVPLFLIIFASAYFLMAQSDSSNFSESLSRTDALYFAITVFSTVGFGDIVAKSGTARVVVMVQMLADLAVLGFGVRVFLSAVQIGRGRSSRTTGDGGNASADGDGADRGDASDSGAP